MEVERVRDESVPEFENEDHAIIWKLLTENLTKKSIAMGVLTEDVGDLKVDVGDLKVDVGSLKTDTKWVKYILIFVHIPLICIILSAVIS